MCGVACSYPRPADVLSDGEAPIDASGPSHVDVALIPIVPNRNIDLLFVIDDSPGMLEMQNALKTAFPMFVGELGRFTEGLPNMHIGVVTSDLGTKGAADSSAGPGIGSGPGSCSGTGKAGNLQTNGTTLVTGTFISDTRNTDGTRTTNYTGPLVDALSAIASVGAAGCGFEQHIEAARRALDNNPANAGFLRTAANLVVVIVGDEDDCSFAHSTLLGTDPSLGPLQSFRCTRFGITCDYGGATPDEMNVPSAKTSCHSNETSPYLTKIADYTTYFRSLKSDPRNVMFGAIAGDPTPLAVELRAPPGGGGEEPALAHACSLTSGTKDPAVRMDQLVNTFARGTQVTACRDDLAPSLLTIARQIRTIVGDPCIPRDIAMPADCVLFDTHASGETEVPACGGAVTTDCFDVVSDAAQCPLGQHLRVNVMRSAAPAADTMMALRCKL
jgi:hypothetical protein